MGLCAVSVALAVGGFGGTVAAADTETDSSVSESHDHGLTDQQHTEVETQTDVEAASPATDPPSAVVTIPTLLGALGGEGLFGSTGEETQGGDTERQSEAEQSPGPAGPMSLGTTTENEPSAAPPAPTVAADDNKGSDTVSTSATEQVNEPEVPAAAVSYSPVTEPSTEPSPEPEAPPSVTAAPADTGPVEQSPDVTPVTNEVALVGDSGATAPAHAEAAPTVVGPAAVGDFITALAYLFITMPDHGVPFLALPGKLLSLLGFPFTADVGPAGWTAGGIGGSLLASGMTSAARTYLASSRSGQASWPDLLIASVGAQVSSSDRAVAHQALDGVTAGAVDEVHLSAVTLADSVVPKQVRDVLQHTVAAVLAPLSLLLLAALASPGIAGLVLFGAAGTFFGYRQARAASILRAVGIARFVKSGPLGVVRSGGLVAVHSRTPRADRRQSRASATSLETVA